MKRKKAEKNFPNVFNPRLVEFADMEYTPYICSYVHFICMYCICVYIYMLNTCNYMYTHTISSPRRAAFVSSLFKS
jgi:hypothetical protein